MKTISKKLVLIGIAVVMSGVCVAQEKITISLQTEQSECDRKFVQLKKDLENYRKELLKDSLNSQTAAKWEGFREKIDSINIVILECNKSSDKKIESFQKEIDVLYSHYETVQRNLEEERNKNLDETSRRLSSKMEDIVKRQDLLSVENTKLDSCNSRLITAHNSLKNDYSVLQKNYKDTCLLLSAYLKKDKIFNTGLAFGCNVEYSDSLNRSYACGMLSAVFSFKIPWFWGTRRETNKQTAIKKQNPLYFPVLNPRFLINIPLVNTNFNNETWTGLFNSKTALGLGIGFDLGKAVISETALSLFYIVNLPSTMNGRVSHYIGVYIPLL